MQTIDFTHPKDAAALEALKKIPLLVSSFAILFLLLYAFPNSGNAQIEKWDSLTNLARTYHQQKEYLKSNECYEQVISIVKPFDADGRLTNKIKGMIALNYVYLGVPLFKAKKYEESKSYFEKALEYSANDPKVLPMAKSWMGDWYSSQALQIRIAETNLEQAIKYSLLAEKYYTLANAPDKCLREQISRAMVLADISRIEDARQLLQQVISECEGEVRDKRTNLLAKALNELGAIEQNTENYQMAILYLEQSYNLNQSSDRQNARIAANRMQRLYESQIPDKTKAELWKKRADELND